MAAYGLLTVDGEYELSVLKIKPAAGRFINKFAGNTGVTNYSHEFYLVDRLNDDPEYKCQVCDVNETQSYCKAGDLVRVRVKSYKQGIHNIEFIRSDSPKTTAKPVVDLVPNHNPIIANTVAAVAINASINYYSVRETPNGFDDVITIADKIYTYLINKYNNQPF